MTGAAIISLDCEGRWGVADHLTPETAAGLTDARLRLAYGDLIRLLADAQIHATFAFVGLFTRPASRETTELVQERAAHLPYLTRAAAGLADSEEGWIGDWALDMAAEQGHEIAFHGTTHVPWPDLSRDQARWEMEQVQPDHRQTMVFPRNQIAHVDVLEEFGCKAFRGAREYPTRAQSLLSEFNCLTPSQAMPDRMDAAPVEIPSGVFINWRSGLRKLVPPAVTRQRARHLLDHAAKSGGVAHFWLHPENVATAPATMTNVAAVVEEIVRFRDAGKIRVETQLSMLGG